MTDARRTTLSWALGTVAVTFGVTFAALFLFDASFTGPRDDDLRAQATEIREAQHQADRLAAVQSCTSEYAATYSAWDGEADRLFGTIVADAFADRVPSEALLARFVAAGEKEAEMNGRRLGLTELSRRNRHEPFMCPPIPERLQVEPTDPTEP